MYCNNIFIKLRGWDGEPVYLNIAHVVVIEGEKKGGCWIRLVGGAGVGVKENGKDVMKTILKEIDIDRERIAGIWTRREME